MAPDATGPFSRVVAVPGVLNAGNADRNAANRLCVGGDGSDPGAVGVRDDVVGLTVCS